MIQEILEIPEAARRCHEAMQGQRLPTGVPYLGMGSSYFAALALRYNGIPVRPEVAADYFHYGPKIQRPLAVLISQSGKSSETLWCRDLFDRYIAVVNDEQSPLATDDRVLETITLKAGAEHFTSSKTYINTLIALFNGHNLNPEPAIEYLDRSMTTFQAWGEHAADTIAHLHQSNQLNGMVLLGSGPNKATALMGALGLQESAKLYATGLSTPEYDHGPKEAAAGSIVISLEADGPDFQRSQRLLKTVRAAGATTLSIHHPELPPPLTPITHILPLFFLMHFLAQKLGITETFAIGGKVTEVSE